MPSHWNKQSYTYKSTGACDIQADVYQVGSSKNQPVIVWIHGGALIIGHRDGIPQPELRFYLQAGFTVVSIDYRLAPETKLPGIIDDVQDALQWVREKGPGLFSIDPDRLAVIGHSAGGYLALMAGFCSNPLPQAVVSFYGYGDIIGPWYSQPDPYYCQQELIQQDIAYGSVGQVPLAGSEDWNRFLFYLYCRQHGLWPQEVTGQNPHTNPGWFSRYCPIQNVTASYAPTLLIHGDQDTDVPYQQSLEMAAVLEQQQVTHQLLTAAGLGHGFDDIPSAREDPVVSRIFEQVVDFLQLHCGSR